MNFFIEIIKIEYYNDCFSVPYPSTPYVNTYGLNETYPEQPIERCISVENLVENFKNFFDYSNEYEEEIQSGNYDSVYIGEAFSRENLICIYMHEEAEYCLQFKINLK